MKNAFATAGITLGITLVGVGCNPKPSAYYNVEQSALPPAAKSLLSPEAQVTGVRLAEYAKGNKDYVIDYTIDGVHKQAIYADYHQSQPTFVFERFEYPKMR